MSGSDVVIQVETEKANLARKTGGATSQGTVDESPSGDPGPDRQQDEILAVLSDTLDVLTDRGHVDVVLEDDGCDQCLADGGDHLRALPARELRCEREVVGAGAQHPGRSDHDLVDASEGDVGLIDETLRRLAQLGDDGLGGAVRRSCRGAVDHLPGEVDQCRPHPFAPDVEAEHPARAGVDVVELGARARAAAGPPDLAEQPKPYQLAEHLRDRGLGEAGAPDDLRCRQRPADVHELEGRAKVDGPKEARLRGFRCRHPRRLQTKVSKVGYPQYPAGRGSLPSSSSDEHLEANAISAMRGLTAGLMLRYLSYTLRRITSHQAGGDSDGGTGMVLTWLRQTIKGRPSTRRLRVVTAILAGGLLAAACGSATTNGPTANSGKVGGKLLIDNESGSTWTCQFNPF